MMYICTKYEIIKRKIKLFLKRYEDKIVTIETRIARVCAHYALHNAQ